MKLPRDLSGETIVKCLCKSWEYHRVHQTGSHIILDTEVPSHHRISIPSHESLRVGTLNSILRVVAEHKGSSREFILKSLK